MITQALSSFVKSARQWHKSASQWHEITRQWHGSASHRQRLCLYEVWLMLPTLFLRVQSRLIPVFSNVFLILWLSPFSKTYSSSSLLLSFSPNLVYGSIVHYGGIVTEFVISSKGIISLFNSRHLLPVMFVPGLIEQRNHAVTIVQRNANYINHNTFDWHFFSSFLLAYITCVKLLPEDSLCAFDPLIEQRSLFLHVTFSNY
jgi:hypothetical protein